RPSLSRIVLKSGRSTGCGERKSQGADGVFRGLLSVPPGLNANPCSARTGFTIPIALGPTPCSASNSASLHCASCSSRVTPASASALVAGRPIFGRSVIDNPLRAGGGWKGYGPHFLRYEMRLHIPPLQRGLGAHAAKDHPD